MSFGSLADLHSPKSYEPKDLAEEDNPVQVKPLFFHRPSMTSTFDSAENIATPSPESDLDDEQIRTMLASPLYLQEREASADRSRVQDSLRRLLKRKLSVKFISLSRQGKPVARECTRKPVALFSNEKEVESRSTFRHRRFFLRTSTGSWKQRTSIQIL